MANKIKVFSVYDQAVGAFMQPFFMQSKGQAIRAFHDLVRDPKTNVAQHPKDFTLFELAEYDEDKGCFNNHSIPVALESALEAQAVIRSERDPSSEQMGLPLGAIPISKEQAKEMTQ